MFKFGTSIRRLITKGVYHTYNLLQGNALSGIYESVKYSNDSGKYPTKEEIDYLLKKYGYEIPLESNRLQTKENIRSCIEGVDHSKVRSWVYTGGSYGEPLRIPYSTHRTLIRTATFRYFNELGGYSLGDPFAIIRAKDNRPLMKFLRNEMVFIPYDLSENRIRDFISVLRYNSTEVMLGYPSVMYELALYLERNPLQHRGLKLRSLISVSEPLESTRRDVIQREFKCKFIDRYSNEEVGLIAQQKTFGGPYFINNFGLYVEIVDPETLQPVREGARGKVVVTDLCNDLIPIIRYDTGDIAIAGEYKDCNLLSLVNIEGRVSEKIFGVDGNYISPLTLGPPIYRPLAREGKIFQYQFAQIGESLYRLRIKGKSEQLHLSLRQEIIGNLMTILGRSAVIEIESMDEIEPLPSGKRPIYVNEFIN
jgi:phenylacetate-CoA ligase